MANRWNLPTTVAAFIRFLEGDSVEPYGDNGTAVIDALRSAVQAAIYEGLGNAVRQRRAGTRIDEVQFLRRHVFHTLQTPFVSALTSHLSSIDDNVFDVIVDCCLFTCSSFVMVHLTSSSENNLSLISSSPLLSLVSKLLQDCHKGEAPTQVDDYRAVKISEELLLCIRKYLADLKDDEDMAQQAESLTLKPRASVRGNNMQEALDGDLLGLQEWQNAWNQPFRGRALHVLETKLQLNAHAIRNDDKKEQMSRIIPVVQASGTGKSRLSKEYGLFLTLLMTYRFVKKNFAVMLSLRNGSSFPYRVCLRFLFSDCRMHMCRSTSKTP